MDKCRVQPSFVFNWDGISHPRDHPLLYWFCLQLSILGKAVLGMAQPVRQSLALGAVVGDFRGPECQIGLSRPGDSSLLPPASPLPISHPTSLPPTVQLRNHILSWAQAFPGLGYGRATGEAKMGKGHVLEQKVWADSAGCSRNTDVSFSEINARAFIIRANTISAGDKSPWLISCTRFYGNDVWMPPDLNWLFAITEPFHGGWWREPWTGNWGSSSVVL